MNDIKISLVFACYNVANYLEQLYKLLITQPYKNIEIIFVEDCSTDNTKDILKGFTDSRVRLIENPINMGAAISRNVGMNLSTGDYIWFPDPDDLFDENLIFEVANICYKFSPEVILCGMKEVYEINGIIKYEKDIFSNFSEVIKDNFSSALVNLEETFLFGYTNNKFYKSSTLSNNNIKNKSLALKEDFDFNIQVFNVIDSFYILNKPYYFYKKRNNSSLTTKFVPEYWDIHKNSVATFKELLEKDKSLSIEEKTLLVNRFFRFFISAIERNANREANMSFKQQKDWILSVLSDKEIDFYLNNLNFLSGKFKYLIPILRGKSVNSLVLLGNMIKVLKKNFPILFSKIKG